MSTRILTWNLQQFSLTKLSKVYSKPIGVRPKQTNLQHITNNVLNKMNPDIFIIVEVKTFLDDADPPGMVMKGNSIEALFMILKELRAKSDDWCLVPPLYIGGTRKEEEQISSSKNREAIAVFYKAKKLQFIGPYVLSTIENDGNEFVGGVPSDKVPDLAKDLKKYTDDFLNNGGVNAFSRYTDGRKHPSNGLEIPEDQFAGQFEYYDSDNKRIGFPEPANRPPFHTKFLELDISGKPIRTLNIFSVHTSPKGNYTLKSGKSGTIALGAVINLATVEEIKRESMNKEAFIVTGDFNVDSFHEDFGYKELIKQDYKMIIDPDSNADNYPYCQTTIKKGSVDNDAIEKAPCPFNKRYGIPKKNTKDEDYLKYQQGDYPAYGYLNRAYDNFLVRQTGGAILGGHNYNITIVNDIIGKPYDWNIKIPDPTKEDIFVTPDVSDYLKEGETISAKLTDILAEPGLKNKELGGVDFEKKNAKSVATGFKERLSPTLKVSDHLAVSIDI